MYFNVLDAGQGNFWDSKMVFLLVLGCLILAALVFVLVRLRKRSMEFEYYYNDDEMNDRILLHRDEKAPDDSDRMTQKLFAGNAGGRKLEGLTKVALRNLNDGKAEYVIELDGSKTIGRTFGKCDVAIQEDKSISGIHCTLRAEKGAVFIRDLDSTNGTWVNGRRVEYENYLKTGDRLQLGHHEYNIEVINNV